MKKSILLLSSILIATGLIFAQTINGSLNHQGLNRTYLVHLPPSYAPGASLPLVFVLHGATQTGQRIMQVSGFNNVADANDFIAVYPDGINLTWNVGFAIPGASTADDLGFLEALADEMATLYNADLNRLYSCGFSNGGYMSYRLACESSKCFAAVGSVTGVMTDAAFAACSPSRSVPVMHIHGTGDAIVAYNGAVGMKSVDEVLAYWLFNNNNCTGNPVFTPVPNTSLFDFTTVDRFSWNPCDNGAEVELLRVNGGGHQWPGTTTLLGGLGAINQDINASQELWNFFSRFTCNQTAANPIPPAPTVTSSPAVICQLGGSTTLTATAPGGNYEWFAGPIGGAAIASGATFTTPALLASATYWVQTTIAGATSARTPVTVTVDISPQVAPLVTALPLVICAGSNSVLTSTLPVLGTINWYDAAIAGNLLGTGGIFTTPALTTTTTYWAEPVRGNCVGPRTAITVTVNPTPSAPTVSTSASTVCQGSTSTLTATGGSGIFTWYDSPTGGIWLWTGANYTTLPLFNTTTLYVQETNANLCSSPRTAITITVNPAPAAPTATATPSTVCSGNSAILNATAPGGTYEWYNVPVGGTPVGSGASYTTPALSLTTVYWVQTIDANGCSSLRTAVTVNVTPTPPAPNVRARPSAICAGNSTLLISRSLIMTNWYDAPTGGNLLANGPVFTTPLLNATTTYYAETSIGGCTSPRTPVTVTVNPLPAAPTLNASPPDVCYGGTTSISVTAPGGVYQWFTIPTGGFPVWVGSNFITPPLFNQTTYYVQTTDVNGCTSPRAAITITVKSFVNQPTVATPAPVCAGTSATITATATAGTIMWYNVPAGGTAVGSGLSFTTPALTGNTRYWVSAESLNCSSIRVPVTVTVIPTPIAPFSRAWPSTVCSGGTAFAIAVSPGATISWYDASSGGNLLATGPFFATPPLTATTTFYAEPSIQGCSGPRSAVTITLGNCKNDNNGGHVLHDGMNNDRTLLSVYPNPSSGIVQLDYSGEDKSYININIYDTNGKLVFKDEFSQKKGLLKYNRTIDLTNMSKGMYLLQILTDEQTEMRKLMIN